MSKSKNTKRSATQKKQVSSKKVVQKNAPLGVVAFSRFVLSTLWSNKRLFGGLALIAWIALLVVSGSTQHQQYLALRDLTFAATDALGVSGGVLQSLVLLLSLLSGGLATSLGEGQQLWVFFIYVFVWLSVVWLLRHLLAGRSEVGVRDGLYNAGAPLLSTLAIVVVGFVQLLPMALAVLALAAAKASGLLEGVGGALILTVVVAVVGGLSLYWLTTTFMAGVIVSIPGTYPFDALRTARSVVKGHRVSLLLRLVWLSVLLLVVVALVLLAALLVDVALQLTTVSLVVGLFQLLTVLAAIYGSAYIYFLYRGMIDA